uniref:Integrator complex subunit 4 n=1 Tax=Ditylenchus dipsaci TaxID=166011 RepID=A0A915D9U0_9BILA
MLRPLSLHSPCLSFPLYVCAPSINNTLVDTTATNTTIAFTADAATQLETTFKVAFQVASSSRWISSSSVSSVGARCEECHDANGQRSLQPALGEGWNRMGVGTPDVTDVETEMVKTEVGVREDEVITEYRLKYMGEPSVQEVMANGPSMDCEMAKGPKPQGLQRSGPIPQGIVVEGPTPLDAELARKLAMDISKEKKLMLLAEDCDPRVRTSALQGLTLLCEGDQCLSLSSYRRITELCDNSEKNVRLMALRIVFVFAEKYPDHEVTTAKGFQLRLQDDAFAFICHLMNDLEPVVRAEAGRLLGCFTSVSDSFLHQTLDKKLMRQMRMLSDGTVAKDGGNKWSTGKRACGAFVTALEDEFMAVRQAAVYSLGKLAANRPEFAKKCIDHLADMFNDEIQQVRLDAIRALSPLVIHGTIQQDQLHTILTGLDDANAENRTAIHELLSKSNLADADCVKQFSIYECLSAIGLHHSVFVHGLVTEMLEIHPIFDTPEQHIDDDFYLGKLILVLNAASNHSVICSLIPAYVKKHYRYLRCAAPKLIPVVKEIEESKVRAKMFDFSTLADSKVDYLLRSTYERISEANSKELTDRVILLDMILKDLHAYQNIEQEIAIPAGFLHRFCRVVKLYNVAMSSSLTTNSTEPVFISYAECMEDIFWIENQYSGTNKSVLAFLAECSFKLLVLVVAMTLDASNYQQFVTTIRDGLLKANRRLIELDVSSSESMSNLVTWIALNLPGVEDKVKMEPIKMEVQSVLILRQKLLSLLKGCYEIGEVVRFVSGLPTGILLTCHLSNLTATDLENFRIEIKYPDTTLAYFRPRPTDIHRLSEQMLRSLISKTEFQVNDSEQVQCFVPLADADFRCFVNKIAVKIHPVPRA